MKINLIKVSFDNATDVELQSAAHLEGADEFVRLNKLLDKDKLSKADRKALVEFLKSLGFQSIQTDANNRLTNPDALTPFEVGQAMYGTPDTDTETWLKTLGFQNIEPTQTASDLRVFRVNLDSTMVREALRAGELKNGGRSVRQVLNEKGHKVGTLSIVKAIQNKALVMIVPLNFNINL